MTAATAVRRLGTVVAMLVATGLSLAVGAEPALAHAELVRTTPANGQVLRTGPAQVLLQFSEPVDLGLGAVQVLGSNGRPVAAGPLAHPRDRSDTVVLPVKDRLTVGSYTVVWRVVSSDSHPVQGAFTFSVGTSSTAGGPTTATTPAATHQNRPPGSRVVAAVYGVTRVVAFAGLAVLVGAAFFVAVCWPAGARDTRTRMLMRCGWVALAGATVAGLLLYGPYAEKTTLARLVSPTLLAATLQTQLGKALTLRLLLLLLAAGGVVLLLRHTGTASDTRRRRTLHGGAVAVGAGALAVTWSAADHSRVGAQVPVAMAADVLHLVAMSVWIGGLVLLAVVLLPTASVSGVRAPVRRFSTIALGCVCVLVVTGTYQAWRQVGTWTALTSTDYGGILLLKLAVVLVLLALAVGGRAWVRRHERPAVAPLRLRLSARTADRDELALLRRSVLGEVLVAVLVLALTAALVDTETARTAYARAERSGSARLVASTGAGGVGAEAPGATPPSAAPVLRTLPYVAGAGPSGRGLVQLVLGSAAVGRNVLHLAVTDRAGKPTDPAELTVTAGLSKPAIGPVPLRLVKSGSGHYIALPTFPMAGRWKLNVVVRTSEVDQVTVSTAVEIR